MARALFAKNRFQGQGKDLTKDLFRKARDKVREDKQKQSVDA